MSDVTLLTGAVWGLAGAVVMVLVMAARGGDSPPPFAVFWARFLGDGDPGAAMPQSLLLHAVYAAVAGEVYVLVLGSVDLGLPVTTYTGGIVWGVVWAVVLLIGAMAFWGKLVLKMAPNREQMLTIALAHLGYGLTLGLLVAAVPHLR